MQLHTLFRLALNKDESVTKIYSPEILARLIDTMLGDLEHILLLKVLERLTELQRVAYFKCWLTYVAKYPESYVDRVEALTRGMSLMLMPISSGNESELPLNVVPISAILH